VKRELVSIIQIIKSTTLTLISSLSILLFHSFSFFYLDHSPCACPTSHSQNPLHCVIAGMIFKSILHYPKLIIIINVDSSLLIFISSLSSGVFCVRSSQVVAVVRSLIQIFVSGLLIIFLSSHCFSFLNFYPFINKMHFQNS
jgi:hypothetical protein